MVKITKLSNGAFLLKNHLEGYSYILAKFKILATVLYPHLGHKVDGRFGHGRFHLGQFSLGHSSLGCFGQAFFQG